MFVGDEAWEEDKGEWAWEGGVLLRNWVRGCMLGIEVDEGVIIWGMSGGDKEWCEMGEGGGSVGVEDWSWRVGM